MSMNSKIALVTGATRGIGQAIAQQLVVDGFFVIGTATSEKGAASITESLQTDGNCGVGMLLDVREQKSVEDLLSRIGQEYGAPSVLINNAGITRDNLLLRMDDDQWDEVIQTDLSSVYKLTKACLRAMFKSRWGRVISVGSVVGSMGNAGQVNYCAAKAGVIGFSKSLAQEISSRGITVNVVSPGFIETDMTAALPDAVKSEMLKRIPMKSLGQVQDIADTVSFLASDRAKYITGETIHVNGGMHMV